MRILFTGGTGFIGSAVTKALLSGGNEVVILSRQGHDERAGCRIIRSLDEVGQTEELDAVINLAGASLAARRWTSAYKREIVDSRLHTTRQVINLLARLNRPPEVLLSASAIGFYGHHGDERLRESSAVIPGFAQALCNDWEAVALEAQPLGVRVCLLRLGVVLDGGGGALAEMTKSFRLGIASWLGTGKQWLSWVHREDVVRAILFLQSRNYLQGPFNLTSPGPVTGRDFCKALKAHHRTFIQSAVPAPVMRALVGEMADELLLRGQRVLPERLQEAGFDFAYSDLGSALESIYSD